MARKLTDVVRELADDDQARERFRSDPSGFAAASGLNPHHQSLLVGGDEAEIRKAIEKESGGGAGESFMIVMR